MLGTLRKGVVYMKNEAMAYTRRLFSEKLIKKHLKCGIIGAPNAGKSLLLNRLLNAKVFIPPFKLS